MSRAQWTPGALIPGNALAAQVALLAIAIIRGLDYGTGESEDTARRLGAVEQAAPMWLWGLLFTTAAAVAFCAMAWRWSAGIVAGHTALAGLYAAVGVGIVFDVLARSEHSGGQPTWLLIIPACATTIAIIGARHHPHELTNTVLGGVCAALLIGAVTISLDGLRNATVLLGLAALHAIIAVGTAQLAAQDDIRRTRGGGRMWKQP
ncbi:hypothetical protein [Corynebacterium liangguodongii]|uniref:hypothetical protein n=1 Tax=Corynebacterium liangguodongii TaxID=2079535 RepID=UPI0011B26442|nr:hypothetical protein [Corynebacterium liangguodongii]